jgi:hypothetical protein
MNENPILKAIVNGGVDKGKWEEGEGSRIRSLKEKGQRKEQGQLKERSKVNYPTLTEKRG